jgi:hypothetical protein
MLSDKQLTQSNLISCEDSREAKQQTCITNGYIKTKLSSYHEWIETKLLKW